MNSLEDLNNFNGTAILEYTDFRNPTVEFDRPEATNQSVTVNEGATFPVNLGIEIVDVVEPTTSAPTYTIDVSSLAGTTVSWTTVPSGCTVTNPSTGVYTISGITTQAIWDIVKYPNISLAPAPPNGFSGTFSYTASVDYTDGVTGSESQEWTVVVTVLDVTILNNALDQRYDISTTTEIENTPSIIDLDSEYPGATWTIEATPSPTNSITSFSSSSTSGGTFTYSAVTKGFTIVGTRAQVNAHLSALSLTSNTVAIDFVLTYQATNDQDAATDTKYQNFKNIDVELLSNPTPIIYYIEDTTKDFDSGLTITDEDYTGSGDYTLVITPSTTSAVNTMSSTGTGGTSTFDNGLKTLTLVGTKTQVNERLTALSIVPATDYDQNFSISYDLTSPESDTVTKLQNLYISSSDDEISNMITRNYVSNNENSLFATDTPVITDFDTDGGNYSISLNCSFGLWSSDGTTLSNPYTYTGTKAQVNSHFSTIKFYPDANISANGTFTYTQLKNGVTQLTQTVGLTGSVGSYSDSRSLTFLTTQNWTPTLLDVRYGEVKEITLVGGGGGGSAGGGGGGQVIYSDTEITISNQTYSISVGAGGAAGNSNITANGGANGYNGGNTTAFGLTALGGGGGGAWTNSAPFTGAQGGYSYGPDGTQYPGGTGQYLNNGLSGNSFKEGINCGGGEGSGGTGYGVAIGSSISAVGTWQGSFGGEGGIGAYAPLGGINAGGVDGTSYYDFYNFGFGGAGGSWYEQAKTQNAGGYRRELGGGSVQVYSMGANRHYDDYDGSPNSTFQGTSAQDTPRASSGTAFVAGGGGAGGAPGFNSVAPPLNGGDGVVLIRIGSK